MNRMGNHRLHSRAHGKTHQGCESMGDGTSALVRSVTSGFRSKFLITLLIVMVLNLSILLTACSSLPEAKSVDILFSGFGTATIDGRISSEEWDNAARLDFTANVPQGGTAPATLFVMNDSTNLYLAVKVARTRLGLTGLGFAFDQDLDGQRDAGFLLNSPNDFHDHFGIRLDVALGGTNDGLGMVTNDGTLG